MAIGNAMTSREKYTLMQTCQLVQAGLTFTTGVEHVPLLEVRSLTSAANVGVGEMLLLRVGNLVIMQFGPLPLNY